MHSKQDRIFDKLADRFQKRIYNSKKGQIRLEILKQEFSNIILPILPETPKVLDAGAGFAQLSLWLAEQNIPVTLCEPSEKMLAVAQASIEDKSLEEMTTVVHSSIQNYQPNTTFDLVLFHAVLEWLASPKETLADLITHLKPQGTLSLMFYNRHSIAMRSLLGGDFQRVREDNLDGVGNKGLTPISPLVPEDVLSWLEEWDMKIIHWSGLRTFYDYMKPEASQNSDLDEIIQMETLFSQKEPWRSLARYQHIICVKQ